MNVLQSCYTPGIVAYPESDFKRYVNLFYIRRPEGPTEPVTDLYQHMFPSVVNRMMGMQLGMY